MFNSDTPNQAKDLDCRAGCDLCESEATNYCMCQVLPFLMVMNINSYSHTTEPLHESSDETP